MMAPHSGAQGLQGAELKLLHRSLGPAELLRDFSYAFLVNKAADNHQMLIQRQPVYQLKEYGPPLNFRVCPRLVQRLSYNFRISCGSLPAVCQRIGGNPQQPSGEWNATP